MGLMFSRRVGTDPYYANYEKAFDRLEKECVLIGSRRQRRQQTLSKYISNFTYIIVVMSVLAAVYVGWVQRLPAGTLTLRQHLSRTVPAVAAPVLTALFFKIVTSALGWSEARDAKLLNKLQANKRKMIKELKDSTCFEKTMALIQKFDPDEPPMPAPCQTPVPGTVLTQSTGRAGTVPRVVNGAPATPPPGGFGTPLASAAAGAGRALFPVFDRLASSMIGDNPVLLDDLRRAQAMAVALKQENDQLKQQLHKMQQQCAPQHLALTPQPSRPLPEEGSATLRSSFDGNVKGTPVAASQQQLRQQLSTSSNNGGGLDSILAAAAADIPHGEGKICEQLEAYEGRRPGQVEQLAH